MTDDRIRALEVRLAALETRLAADECRIAYLENGYTHHPHGHGPQQRAAAGNALAPGVVVHGPFDVPAAGSVHAFPFTGGAGRGPMVNDRKEPIPPEFRPVAVPDVPVQGRGEPLRGCHACGIPREMLVNCDAPECPAWK